MRDRIRGYLRRAGVGRDAAAEMTDRVPAIESADRVESPGLTAVHVAGATIFADRVDALAVVPPGGWVAEIGVAFGDFTEVLLRTLEPARFDAFDLFRLHEIDHLWGRPMVDWLGGRSHRAHYETRFAEAITAGTFHVHEGDSAAAMDGQPDESYDLIYVDGDHHLDGVRRDAEVAVRKVAPDGILVSTTT